MVVLSLALVGSLSQSCDKMQVSVWLAYSLSIPAEILYTGSSVSGLSLSDPRSRLLPFVSRGLTHFSFPVQILSICCVGFGP